MLDFLAGLLFFDREKKSSINFLSHNPCYNGAAFLADKAKCRTKLLLDASQ